MDADVRALSDDVLAQRCEERPPNYRRTSSTDGQMAADRFCLELLRRAFEGNDDHALGLVMDLYKRVWSRLWIRDAAAFEHQPQTADDFKNTAFFNVYETLKGTDLSAFKSLTPFLSYLYKSVVRSVAAYYRSSLSRGIRPLRVDELDDQQWEQIPSDEDIQGDVESKLLWQAIEQRIALTLKDEKDRFVFECWAKQDLTRAEIVREYNARWPDLTFDSEAARAALQRVRRHLIKDNFLRELLKQYVGHSTSSKSSKD